MNEKLVPSLELCQRLAAAGWKAETEFVWGNVGLIGGERWVLFSSYNIPLYVVRRGILPAPTLGETLPILLTKGDIRFWAHGNQIACEFDKGNEITVKHADTPENACALMWLELNEKGKR